MSTWGRRRDRPPLPAYEDASMLWHYHVLCRHCHPYGLTSEYVYATRRDALAVQEELNASILGPTHQYVILGCALEDCRPQPDSRGVS